MYICFNFLHKKQNVLFIHFNRMNSLGKDWSNLIINPHILCLFSPLSIDFQIYLAQQEHLCSELSNSPVNSSLAQLNAGKSHVPHVAFGLPSLLCLKPTKRTQRNAFLKEASDKSYISLSASVTCQNKTLKNFFMYFTSYKIKIKQNKHLPTYNLVHIM